MSNNIIELRHHKFNKGDKILIDTNVWLYIHGPFAVDWRTTAYSATLKNLRTYNCKIFIDGIILSEFINAFSRYEFETSPNKTKYKNFKEFRKSAEFKAIAGEISACVSKILRISNMCDSYYCSLNVHDLVSHFSSGDYDFNDIVLEELCKNKGFALLTHDGDFSGKGIDILTANNKLGCA